MLLGLGILCSTNRRAIDYKLVLSGLAMTISVCLLVSKVPVINTILEYIGSGFVTFLGFSSKGAEFLFGDLAKNSNTSTTAHHTLGFIFAFQVLPNILFFATVTAALYYLGILQKIVWIMAWTMSKTMRLSGAESLSAAGNVFLGPTEAPLLVKPFIEKMTLSELHCMMTVGMSTIAGGVMAAYILILGGNDVASQSAFASHLLTASIMNAPTGIIFAKIIYPETQPIDSALVLNKEKFGVNLLDAISKGASEGMQLALSVGAMLLAFISVIAMLNYFTGDILGGFAGINEWVSRISDGQYTKLSLQFVLGELCRPIAYLMGVSWQDTLYIGSLIGQKTVLNEFVAYINLQEMREQGLLSSKSVLIATYSLCGFSNFSSIAIQFGGISVLAPNQKENVALLGLRALLAASLACILTGTLAGIFIV
ncbi:MAG: nucleoside transporter C-terminal domain-containing protein [Cytophagales bacterium]|nr:nucleoside transporter C-terminal domain-containing protein [Cytophagales bacterium]